MKLKIAGKVYLDPENPIDLGELRDYLKEDAMEVVEKKPNEGVIGWLGHTIGKVNRHYISTFGTGGKPHITETGREVLEKKLDKLL